MQCFNCNAELQDELEICQNCGLSQKQEDTEINVFFKNFTSEKNQNPFLYKVAAFGMLAAFVLGVWVGAVLFGQDSDTAAPTSSTIRSPQNQVKAASFEAQINAFILRINNLLHLDIISWFKQPDGSVVFEMARPTEDSPVLWEALTRDERYQIFGYLSAAYTTQVWQAGDLQGLSKGHFPVLILTYSKFNRPLAVRDSLGNIHIYASPYEAK